MNYRNPPVLGDAIVALRPGSEFALKFGGDYNLEWLDSNTTPPTQEEAEAKLQELLQEYENKQYQRQREPEYPPITDYVDACYWASKGDTTKLDEYYAKCEAVKTKYPKPE